MTTEDQNRLPEIIDYFSTHPTPRAGDSGGQHVHIHHHYAAAPAPPPPPEPSRGQKLLDQMVPYFILGLFAMIILTGCAIILFMFAAALVAIILSVVAGLVALVLVIAVLAYLVRSTNEGRAVKALAADHGKRRR
jgi:hypothetical protein